MDSEPCTGGSICTIKWWPSYFWNKERWIWSRTLSSILWTSMLTPWNHYQPYFCIQVPSLASKPDYSDLIICMDWESLSEACFHLNLDWLCNPWTDLQNQEIVNRKKKLKILLFWNYWIWGEMSDNKRTKWQQEWLDATYSALELPSAIQTSLTAASRIKS